MIHSERFLKIVDDALTRVREITPEETLARLQSGDGVIVIDTREESEWARGHVAGAIYLGKGIIERDIEKTVPDLDRPIVLYCGGGYRSALAADTLQKMGYTNVASMSGGWRGWTELGLPTE
jgi:rhodanese-related sulfurtransferase